MSLSVLTNEPLVVTPSGDVLPLNAHGNPLNLPAGTLVGGVAITVGGSLPTQTGNSGKFLTTNGSAASWASPITATLAGFTSAAGTVSSSDTILGAIQKLDGNVSANTTSIATKLSSIPTGKTIWVDSINGNNSTGTRGRQDLPFLTVAAATSASGVASGDVIRVRGTTTETSSIQLPSGVHLVGDGADVTLIQSALDGGDADANHLPACIVRPGTGSIIADLTVRGTASAGVYQYPIGASQFDSAFTGAKVINVRIIGASDGIYINRSGCSLDIYDSQVDTTYDAVILTSNAGSSVVNVYNSRITVAGPFSVSTPSRGLVGSAGTARIFNSAVSVTGGGTYTLGIAELGSGTVEAQNVRLVRDTSGSVSASTLDLNNVSGTLSVNNVTRDDGAALTTSGTITYLSRSARRDANLSDLTSASTARSNLGLAIGTNVQAWDADLDTWATVTPGTGIATALGVNVGSAGAPVLFNGAGGTPSSITLTNATGLPDSALTSNIVNKTVANTYTAGAKQTFGASATTAGFNFAGVSADPSSLSGGDVWMRSDTGQIKFRTASGQTHVLADLNANADFLGTLSVSGVAVPTISSSSTLTNKTIDLGSNTVTMTKAQLNTAVSDDDPAFLGAANTFTGANIISTSGAASTPALKLSGAPYAAGSATTNFPLFYINDSTATASTTLSTAGTYLGVNGHGTADLINLLLDGTSKFKVTSGGAVTTAGSITATGNNITAGDSVLATNNSYVTNTAGNFLIQNRWALSAPATAGVVGIKDNSSNGGTIAPKPTSPAQITADTNNYNPGGVGYYLRLNTDASRNLTGMVFSTTQADGQTHVIVNVGSNNIVLVNESASSTAANRFHNSTGADITIAADQEVNCWYDATTARWRVSKRGF